MMVEAPTIGIAIDRHWRNLYEAFHSPEAFPAGRAACAGLERPIRVRLTSRNDHGVLDHWMVPGGAVRRSASRCAFWRTATVPR